MAITNISTRVPRSRAQLTDSGSGASPRREPRNYSVGSILGVHMVNFLVYHDTWARVGPRLNVIFGPNGSGKSTILCAIALGLGGNPKILGRADNLHQFVTHNCNKDAVVAIEIFMGDGKPTMTLKRMWSRKSNSSKWFINQRSSTEKEVKEKVAELDIHVDNLCTVLPQDKVGEFSGFSQEQLLVETEKALSRTALFEPHQKLIQMQESAGKGVDEEATTAKKLENLEVELATIEKDVQRFEERQQKQETLELHEKRKAWVLAEELAGQGKAAKEKMKAAQRELAKAEEEDVPLMREEQKWEREQQKIRGILLDRTKKKNETEERARAAAGKIEALEISAGKAKIEITNLEKRRALKETKLASAKTKLAGQQRKLEELREKGAGGETADEIMEKIKANKAEANAVASDLEVQQKIKEVEEMGIWCIDEEIKKLKNLQAQREQRFRAIYRDSATVGLQVREWAARNADRLRGQVSGPIGLEVTVDDEEAAAAVEFHVPDSIWCSMVVDFKEDHDAIIEAFKNHKGSLTVLVNEGGRLRPQPTIFSKEEMKTLQSTAGVRGFLDDFITCSDTVRQILRRSVKVHKAFLGSAATQLRINQDPTFLPSLGKPVNGVPSGTTVFAGGRLGLLVGQAAEPLQMYHAKISLYGQRKASTRVTETRPAKVIAGGVDEDAVNAQLLQRTQREVRLEGANYKIRKISVLLSKLDQAGEKAINEFKNLQSLRKQEATAQTSITRTETVIHELTEELKDTGDDGKRKYINRLENVYKQHVIAVQKLQEEVSATMDLSMEVMAATLAKNATSDKLSDAREALVNAQASRQALEDEVGGLKKEMNRLLSEFRKAKAHAERVAPRYDNGGDTEFGLKYSELPDNLDALDAVIDLLTGELENIVYNPEVIKRHEKLQKDVHEAREALQKLRENNATAGKTMETLCAEWMEYLQNIMDKLNTRFQQYMSDGDWAGEVLLKKHDLYKKWGVAIRVRFRPEEEGATLQDLNKQVQSGGERSVSTIMYLMALQELHSSPFRAVDEINQGMDPKNERNVFSRIVRNSIGPTRKQYFLVTPKLLQGLVAMDDDDVNIIVVMNGVNAFTGKKNHTMRDFINAKRKQLGLDAADEGASPPKRPRLEEQSGRPGE